MNLDKIAENLDIAAIRGKAIKQISESNILSVDEAYSVQSISLSRRYLRHEHLTGLKLGFTSKAKMEQMGVHDMIWGRLTNDMSITCESEIFKSKFIHPRAEPEIAFRFSHDITEEISETNVRSIIDGVAIAIEVIDSRYENFKFSLPDVIADNCSSAGYCIGKWHDNQVDLNNKPIQLSINNNTVQIGNTVDILGNPWLSVVNAVRLALQYGVQIKKGHILLAGAATPASFIHENDVISASCIGLGDVSFRLK